MKKLLFLALMLCSEISFGQNNNQTPPTLNFGYLPFEFAFEIKKNIRADYDAKMLSPSGTDKVLLDAIESQIAANGVNASTRTYSVTNVPMKYYLPIIQKYVNTNFIQAQKAINEYQKVYPILQAITAQNVALLRQIFEMSGSGVRYSEVFPYLPPGNLPPTN